MKEAKMIECKHEKREFRRFVYQKQGKPDYHKVCQCMICGLRLKNGPTGCNVWWPKDSGDIKLPEEDQSIIAAWRLKNKAELERELKAKQTKLADEWQERHDKYDLYINTSVDWKNMRNRVMYRAGEVCEACLVNTATQVHHTNYDSLFDEICWDLRAVCSGCHRKIHQHKIESMLPKGASDDE
jgi:hypothetical protein